MGMRLYQLPFLLSACQSVYVYVGRETRTSFRFWTLVRCWVCVEDLATLWKENGEGCIMLGEANLTHELTNSLQHGACSLVGLSSYVTKFHPSPSHPLEPSTSAAEDTMPTSGDIYYQRDAPPSPTTSIITLTPLCPQPPPSGFVIKLFQLE